MGRVYNALLRAEQLKDGHRPIGRPARNASPRGVREDAPRVFSYAPAAATGQSPFERKLTKSGDGAAPEGGRAVIAKESAGAQQSANAPRPLVVPPRVVSEASAASAPVVTFEEPAEVLNIRDLAVDLRLATLIREDPLAMERCRALAAKLLNLADRRKLKTLLVTSAEAGEGKTTVAASVAWSLAKHPRKRVLLIDANADSSCGRMLGLDAKRGWLNLIDRSCELKQALIRIEPNGLYVITPGAAQQFGAEALSSVEDVIADLAPRFDLVIVDSRAILESPEIQRLAAVMDGTVLVARACHTHHSKAAAARKLIPKERRLGVVLNESEAGPEIAHRGRGKISLAARLFGRKKVTA